MKKLLLILIVVAMIGGSTYAAGQSREDDQGLSELVPVLRPVAYSKTNPPRINVPPNASPSQLARTLASRTSNVIAARVGASSAYYSRAPEDRGERFRGEAAGGLWLYATVKAPGEGPLANRAIWEANLMAGALADRLSVGRLGRLSNVVISLRLPDGTTVEGASGMGNVARAQEFADPPNDVIEAGIRSRAASAGLSVRSIEIVRVDQPAPAVVVTTGDLAAIRENPDAVVRQVFENPVAYEGIYLRVNDTAGNVAMIQASSFRTGAGIRYVRPDLAQRPFAAP